MWTVFERLWATKWVKQVSSGGGVIAVTFSAFTSSHLVSCGTETKCPLSSASLLF